MMQVDAALNFCIEKLTGERDVSLVRAFSLLVTRRPFEHQSHRSPGSQRS
jgi:hypothetical protein